MSRDLQINLPCDNSFTFRALRRGNDTRARHVSTEIRTGHPQFDKAVYLQGYPEHLIEHYFESLLARQAMLELFAMGFDEVECLKTQVIAKWHAFPEGGDPQAFIAPTQNCLRRLAQRFEAIPVAVAPTRRRSKGRWWIYLAIVLIAAVVLWVALSGLR